MAPLTEERDTEKREGKIIVLGVAEGAKIFAGAIVCRNSDGYAESASDAAGLVVEGRAEKTVDNTDGDDGDKQIEIEQYLFKYDAAGMTPADCGKDVFIVDDHTVALAQGNNAVYAGVIKEVASATEVWVQMGADYVAGPWTGDVTINTGATAIGAKKVTAAKIALADGKVLVGGADGAAAAQTPSGDATMTNAGVIAIGAKKVLAAMVALAQGKLFIGGADGAAAAQTLTGDVTVSEAGVTAIGAEKVLLAMMHATAKTHVLSVPVEDLAAGVDIATRAVLEVPAGLVATVTDARILMQGAAAGVDDGNTCVIALLRDTDGIASKTYNTANGMPAENVSGSLGALNAGNKVMAAGTKLHFSVTNGATANPPAMVLQVTYTLAAA